MPMFYIGIFLFQAAKNANEIAIDISFSVFIFSHIDLFTFKEFMFKAIVFSDSEWSNLPNKLHARLVSNISETYTVKKSGVDSDRAHTFDDLILTIFSDYLQGITEMPSFPGHTLVSLKEWVKLPQNLAHLVAAQSEGHFHFIHSHRNQEAIVSHLDLFLYEIFRAINQVMEFDGQQH